MKMDNEKLVWNILPDAATSLSCFLFLVTINFIIKAVAVRGRDFKDMHCFSVTWYTQKRANGIEG